MSEVRWWWLSFADPELPYWQQFLGVCIVQASEPALAVSLAWQLDINPGGEVQIVSLPNGWEPPERYTYRLLNRAEAEAVQDE